MDKKQKLYLVLCAFFIANALIAEFIGSKIFSLEATLGIKPFNIVIFGFNLPFNLTCGVLLWPVVFILTDIINEYFGEKGVKRITNIAVLIIAYAFVMVYLSIGTSPAQFWLVDGVKNGIPNMQFAYKGVFGQGLWIIVGSLVAFLIGQIVDVTVFTWIKNKTKDKYLWLRSTGSTLISQLIDSFLVLFIAFYIGAGWSFKLVLAIGIVNYIYKFTVAILITPVLYILHKAIDKYLEIENK